MKLLFSFAFVLLSLCAFSQEITWDVREHLNKDQKLFVPPQQAPGIYLNPLQNPKIKAPGVDLNTYLHEHSKKDSFGVKILQLDNMPCLVPNTKDIAVMPNAWKGKISVPFRSRMPNPAQPPVKADINTK